MELKMYPYKIEIDANRSDNGEHWRIYRINRIIGYAQALADADNNEKYFDKIESIYEYKGTLTINWKIEPTINEKNYLQIAWGSIVAGYEGNQIEHEI